MNTEELPAVKYGDENSHFWCERGARPGSFKAAFEAGKAAEGFLFRK